ncbi:histone acetyltransferase type B catalytic subunit-like, partial [Dorcoceras hygrometricum]
LLLLCVVSSKEEVDSLDSFQVEPVDLNHFFEEDGKIYGYQGLKITVWISCVSFHAYADISFDRSSDGGKGITDLKSSLQNIFADNLIEKKHDFLQTFSTEENYIKNIVSSAEVLQNKSNNSKGHLKEEHVNVEVYQVGGTAVGPLYCRLVPLILLLVDGSNPIDVTDPSWNIYVLVGKGQQDRCNTLLGFAAVYRFHRYPAGVRLRLGQMLIIPPYQRKGYGRNLLEVLNNVAISENAYDLTVEEPVDSLQHVRTCIDVQRLLEFEPIHDSLDPLVELLKHKNLSKNSQPVRCGPSRSIIESVRKSLKINRRQFLQCWEILIYLSLNPIEKYMENYMSVIANRVKADVIGKEPEVSSRKLLIDIPTEFDQEMSFAMFKSEGGEGTRIEKDENEGKLDDQIRQLVDIRMKEIKFVAEKVSS